MQESNLNGTIAGVVVLYNSGVEVIDNINTYIDQIKKLYVIDNSDSPNLVLIHQLQSFRSIVYIPNIGNYGVADALNIAAHRAINDNFTYLLTMDDDSRAPSNMISSMIDFINNYANPEELGIVSVDHSGSLSADAYKEVNLTMTSGNLLSLHAYQKVGPFNKNLFIDHVDHEYNLRLYLNKFKIIEITNLKLNHKLGTVKKFNLYTLNISYISHNPVRLYYFIRNAIYISRTYFNINPKVCLFLLQLSVKEIVKSSLLEDHKYLRLMYIKKALSAGWQGRLGKLN